MGIPNYSSRQYGGEQNEFLYSSSPAITTTTKLAEMKKQALRYIEKRRELPY